MNQWPAYYRDMSTPKKTYTGTAKNGRTYSKTTTRAIAYFVLATKDDGMLALSMAGRLDLAQKEVSAWNGRDRWTAELFPVTAN